MRKHMNRFIVYLLVPCLTFGAEFRVLSTEEQPRSAPSHPILKTQSSSLFMSQSLAAPLALARRGIVGTRDWWVRRNGKERWITVSAFLAGVAIMPADMKILKIPAL